MLIRFALSVLVLVAATAPAQNLFKKARSARALIADHRASAIGDILTVTVDEIYSVTNEDRVDRSNTSSLAARLEEYSLSDDTFKTNVLPRFDVRQQRQFQGEATQEKDQNIRANIAVVVVDVHPNGNLVVATSRVVRVDDETKTLKISGIVRPLDITQDNRVTSSQVADARISITSEGANTRHTSRGPVASVFETLVWAAWPF